MLELRPLSPADLPAMLLIEQAAYDHPWSASLLASCFGERYLGGGAWHQGQLVGYYLADWLLDESTLMNLCLRPDCRGRGWGRALLGDYLARSTALGCRHWWLEVRRSNRTAQGLYLSAGYHEVGCRRNYYPTNTGREDALLMGRTLDPGA
ncbi:ribosomal protein S18-alanine N-acetyltransferase [Pseudaeromonas paramecii]|uniref:[Ribosomal protein bS18]-alanine N-acetyltransferase n=1 Tax=Pseudaeromonas paramecii TaxID=2138166 RepID=A0ABP8QCU9_9GAMM